MDATLVVLDCVRASNKQRYKQYLNCQVSRTAIFFFFLQGQGFIQALGFFLCYITILKAKQQHIKLLKSCLQPQDMSY